MPTHHAPYQHGYVLRSGRSGGPLGRAQLASAACPLDPRPHDPISSSRSAVDANPEIIMSLVAVGACYVDTILTYGSSPNHLSRLGDFSQPLTPIIRTPHYPSEDEKQRASGLSHRRGGNCPNTLEVLQQLTSTSSQPLSSHLIAVLPARSSFASQRIIAGLEPGVQLNRCIFRENLQEPASCYIIKSQATGSRTIVNFNELPDMTVDEFVERVDGLEPTPAWFHFEVS